MLNRREMITACSATLLAASLRGASFAGAKRDEDASLSRAARSDLTASPNHHALAQLLHSMRTTARTVHTRRGQFADVLTDQTGINRSASRYYAYDARKVVGPDRAFSNTVAPEEDFEDIGDWSVNVGASVIAPSDPDPMVGSVAELDTGANLGSVAVLRRSFGRIPATFGVSVLMGMATSNGSAAEALEVQVQNNQGHQLRMRVFSGAVQFFYNGAWHTQFRYGGSTSTLTEWWFDADHIGGSRYKVRLFAGTQELPGFTGNLPGGTPGENGWVGFIQYSASLAHRKGRVAVLQIGTSALPADMSLVSAAQDVVTEPTRISMALMVEDVSAQTVINTDLKAWISKDGGVTWYQVMLTNYERWGEGVLDRSKPVLFLAGTVSLPASGTHSVCCRITSANRRYFSLNGYAWRVEA